MAKKTRTNNNAALIATVVVALIAAAAAFFAVWKFASATQEDKEAEQVQVYQPSEELSDEMKDAATNLIKENYTVVKLFYTKGVPHVDEPYGNLPEDGIYLADSTEYTSVEQILEIVTSTYSAEEANRIFSNANGNGAVYLDKEGALGISASFEPIEYNISWESVDFRVLPVSDTECNLEVTLHDDTGAEVIKTGSMSKLNGTWLLNSVIY